MCIDECFENLANAIVIQAAKDYRRALKIKSKGRIIELERFFRSEWFTALTKIDCENLIERLRKEQIHEHQN